MKIRVALDYSSNFKINLKGDKALQKAEKAYMRAKQLDENKKPLPTPRIICKHAIFMLMHLHNNGNIRMSNRNAAVIVQSLSFFFKPTKQKYFTLLRAPYRYKIARNQLLFKRFFFRCSILLKVSAPHNKLKIVNSYQSLWAIDSTLTSLYTDLDTNVCTQNKVQISIPFSYTNFLSIKNYN